MKSTRGHSSLVLVFLKFLTNWGKKLITLFFYKNNNNIFLNNKAGFSSSFLIGRQPVGG